MLRTPTPTELDQVTRELDTYGYAKLPAMFAPVLQRKLLHQVEAYYADAIAARGDQAHESYENTRYVFNLHSKDKCFLDLAIEPVIKQIALPKLNDPYYRMLPADVPNYYIGAYNARSSGRALALHIDSHLPSASDHCWMLEVVFILEPNTVERGCTIVVPGTHRSGTFSDRDLQHVVPLTSEPGDIVLWDSRLWHGALANQTNATRWSIIITFMSWWVKPFFDVTRSCPEALYQQLSDEQKALLGFCAIPPRDSHTRIDTKSGYDFLKPTVADYFR